MAACPGAEGVRNFTCDGIPFEVTEDDIAITPRDRIREPLPNGRYTERKTSPAISVTIHVPPEIRLKDMTSKCDSVVVVEFYNGRVFILSGASLTFEEEAFDAQTGKLRAKFIGRSCQELINQGTQDATSAQAA